MNDVASWQETTKSGECRYHWTAEFHLYGSTVWNSLPHLLCLAASYHPTIQAKVKKRVSATNTSGAIVAFFLKFGAVYKTVLTYLLTVMGSS